MELNLPFVWITNEMETLQSGWIPIQIEVALPFILYKNNKEINCQSRENIQLRLFAAVNIRKCIITFK